MSKSNNESKKHIPASLVRWSNVTLIIITIVILTIVFKIKVKHNIIYDVEIQSTSQKIHNSTLDINLKVKIMAGSVKYLNYLKPGTRVIFNYSALNSKIFAKGKITKVNNDKSVQVLGEIPIDSKEKFDLKGPSKIVMTAARQQSVMSLITNKNKN